MAVYGVKGRSEILISILNALEKNAGITAIYPGSIARAFAEAISSEVSDLYEAFRFSLSQMNLSTASGRNLDLIGDLYGIPRKSVSTITAQERQSYNIEFFLSKPHTADININKDTLVYTDVSEFMIRQYSYKLAEDVIIPAGSLKAYGRVEPNFSDNAFVAPVGSLKRHNYLSPPSIVVFCNNPKEVYSNLNSESDMNYRRRIIASFKTKPAGTTESVRFAALSVRGVRDVRIREAAYGIGSCDVIIVPEGATALKPLPEAVLTAIAQAKPVGVRFNVRLAEKVNVGVIATITIPSGNSTNVVAGARRQAELFVKRYLNSLTIGEGASLTNIEQQIKMSSDIIRGVTINSFTANGSELPLQDYNLNTITKYIAAGNVQINTVIIGSSTY
jgi:uncharacterized phage protein gp47/JayE